MKFSVSVVIPVFNAAHFVEQAVDSALAQPETAEVVLVEDGSLDNSLEICQKLVGEFEKVHIFRHLDGINRGAGPSRNLGIQKSSNEFIAFLDADDFYLPGRFTSAKEIFSRDPECSAVYEAVGLQFDDEQGKLRWMSSDMAAVGLTTLTRTVPSEDLFRVLMKGGSGHIHLDGLVIRRSILDKSGYMVEELKLHQDVDFILRIAAVGKLMPGRLNEEVALRRVHAGNRVSEPRPAASVYRDHMRQRLATYQWCKRNGFREQQRLAFRRMAEECIQNKPIPPGFRSKLPEAALKSTRLLAWPFEVPEVLGEGPYWIGLLRSFWCMIKTPHILDESL